MCIFGAMQVALRMEWAKSPYNRAIIFFRHYIDSFRRTHMDKPPFFEDFQSKIHQALENSPAKDIEKNVKAMISQGLAKLDLVTREDFEVQSQILAKTRAKLEALEARVAELESRQK
jgi:BMFP domain-containing protein YqiC